MAVMFARLKVVDLDNFRAVHVKTESAHRRHNITESVWQDADDPLSLTIAIRGKRADIEAWRASPERARLAQELMVERAGESWLTEELFAKGEYGS